MKFPHEYASLRLTNVTWTLHFAKRATLFNPEDAWPNASLGRGFKEKDVSK